jgi:hypothetical protein
VKLGHLVGPNPALLQPPAHRHHDGAKGDLELGPPVTTCDGRREPLPLAQGGHVAIGDADQEAVERPAGVRAADPHADRAGEEVFRNFAVELFHVKTPRAWAGRRTRRLPLAPSRYLPLRQRQEISARLCMPGCASGLPAG